MTQLNIETRLKIAARNYEKRMVSYGNEPGTRVFKPALKFYKRLNVFKASNVSFDPTRIEAFSYRWWKFVAVIGGKVVFNNYRYSPSTGKHQSKVSSLLSQLGVKTDLCFEAPKGLQDLASAVTHYENKISALIVEIQKPGTRKEKNRERALTIKSHMAMIKTIKALMRAAK
jgi:hypothetical protein